MGSGARDDAHWFHLRWLVRVARAQNFHQTSFTSQKALFFLKGALYDIKFCVEGTYMIVTYFQWYTPILWYYYKIVLNGGVYIAMNDKVYYMKGYR